MIGDWEKEDYSSFSLEAHERSIRKMLDDVKQKTGASEEEVLAALNVCAGNFMEANCFKLEGGK